MDQAILDQLKAKLGERWNDLSAEDRTLIAACAADAAAVAALAVTDPAGAAAEKAQTDAQLANLASVGAAEAAAVTSDFWAVVADAAKSAIGLVIKAAL